MTIPIANVNKDFFLTLLRTLILKGDVGSGEYCMKIDIRCNRIFFSQTPDYCYLIDIEIDKETWQIDIGKNTNMRLQIPNLPNLIEATKESKSNEIKLYYYNGYLAIEGFFKAIDWDPSVIATKNEVKRLLEEIRKNN